MPNRVIVIAGASCVGKSTLIGQLHRGEHRPVARQLGLIDPEMWDYANARHMPPAFTDPGATGLVLHYDIVRPMMEQKIGSFADDPGLRSALEAKQLCLCTMWGDGDLIRTRAAIKAKQRGRLDAGAIFSPMQWAVRHRRLRRLLKWYEDDAFIEARYAQWFDYVEQTISDRPHWVVNAAAREVTLVPAADWLDRHSLSASRASAA